MSFWIEINSIPPVLLPGVDGHQWSGRPAAAEVLQTWTASSLAWVDGRGEPVSGLSHIVPFLSYPTHPQLTVPPLLYLFWSDIPHFPLSQSLHPTISPHIRLLWTHYNQSLSQVCPVLKPAHQHRSFARVQSVTWTKITHISLYVNFSLS